jgi:signal transduction histidine kinase
VFSNLIVNAIKYNTSAHKQIWIEPVKSPDELVGFSVRDNGIGIKPAFHQSIFKIFKRLHSKDDFGGGTGTGLTIVKKLIERHGGRIEVESAEGQGTKFVVQLPKKTYA